jgi:hypothetical protein
MRWPPRVTNYLKAEDIERIRQNSAQPLRAEIDQIYDAIPEYARQAMAESRDTREAIVATLRFQCVVRFMLEGAAWLTSAQKERNEALLATYGLEFPEGISPEAYTLIAKRYYDTEFKGTK